MLFALITLFDQSDVDSDSITSIDSVGDIDYDIKNLCMNIHDKFKCIRENTVYYINKFDNNESNQYNNSDQKNNQTIELLEYILNSPILFFAVCELLQ